jgi:oligoribonuclease
MDLSDEMYEALKQKDKDLPGALDALVEKHGLNAVTSWESKNKHRQSLIVELTLRSKVEGLRHVVSKYNMNVNAQRPSDKNTPLHLAGWFKNPDMIDALVELGADPDLLNGYGESASKTIEVRKSFDNFVWLDLELTSLEDPDIIECCVIITDKDFRPVADAEWVIHYEREFLQRLSDWHQTEFKGTAEGGNGLFDDSVASATTTTQFEKELLAFLRQYCVEKHCNLAGSSVHCDREVLRLKHPAVYQFFSHQIIDVSTLFGLMDRWAPQMRKDLLKAPQPSVEDAQRPHRARSDLRNSMQFLQWFRDNWLKMPDSPLPTTPDPSSPTLTT